MTAGAPTAGECAFCNSPAPRLYLLPPRAQVSRQRVGPACYFCFLRLAAIKPTRRYLAAPVNAPH